MNITSLVTALPVPSTTGWGTCGRRLPEELSKLAFVQDLHKVNEGKILKQDFPVDFNVPVIQAIRGVDLFPFYQHLRGTKHVGLSFVEDNLLLRKYAGNYGWWDVIVCGSTWAREQMTIATEGKIPVITAIQGVDSDVFYPNENVQPDPNWFTVFSGGKMEWRKGTDVVIRSVAVMMERHKDVRLVASWWNPWDFSLETMRQSKLINIPSGKISFAAVLSANGIKSNYTLLNQCGHKDLSYQMNRCDVGLFPNRCEAGTNLVLMEAMACGLPVIATKDHGHADVIRELNSVAQIYSQLFIVERAGMAVAEWYEPNLDQTIEALELAYGNRKSLPKGTEYMNKFTWESTAKSLLEACE